MNNPITFCGASCSTFNHPVGNTVNHPIGNLFYSFASIHFLSPQSKPNHFMFDFLQHLFLLFFKTFNFTQNITNTKDNQIPVTLTFCSMCGIVFAKSFTQVVFSCNQIINRVLQNTLIFFSHIITSIFVKSFLILTFVECNHLMNVFRVITNSQRKYFICFLFGASKLPAKCLNKISTSVHFLLLLLHRYANQRLIRICFFVRKTHTF
nr:MAG TPA: hypothetical protein [Caudoviricetes sp.]